MIFIDNKEFANICKQCKKLIEFIFPLLAITHIDVKTINFQNLHCRYNKQSITKMRLDGKKKTARRT